MAVKSRIYSQAVRFVDMKSFTFALWNWRNLERFEIVQEKIIIIRF